MPEVLRCPRDVVQLEKHPVEPGVFWICPHCHGMWVSGDELAVFLEGRGDPWSLPLDPLPRSQRPPQHDEPTCICEAGKAMSSVRAGGVTVDVCRGCGGVWLDGGELGALIRRHRPDLKVGASRPPDTRLPEVVDLLVALLDFAH